MSLNVRGIRNREKKRSIFAYLKNQKANVFFFKRLFQTLEGGGMGWSNFTLHADVVELDTNRFITLRLKTQGRASLNVVNVYASRDNREQI